MRETWLRSLGWEDPPEKRKATHSSILAWRIPWTVQSMGFQRVRHDWATFTFTFQPLLEGIGKRGGRGGGSESSVCFLLPPPVDLLGVGLPGAECGQEESWWWSPQRWPSWALEVGRRRASMDLQRERCGRWWVAWALIRSPVSILPSFPSLSLSSSSQPALLSSSLPSFLPFLTHLPLFVH